MACPRFAERAGRVLPSGDSDGGVARGGVLCSIEIVQVRIGFERGGQRLDDANGRVVPI
jgi:hypothetical protein